MTLRRLLIAVTSIVLLASSGFAQTAGQGAFVPVDSVPLSDQLPAAPLLISAYAFVWLAVMMYLLSIWKRLNKVEDEMRSLAQKISAR